MKNRLFFLITVFATAFLSYSFPQNETNTAVDNPFIVVLDAGHGGHDPGNLGNGYFEKNIALSIVLKIGKILENDPNIKVVYTRDDDTFVDLYVRGEIANKANADLFVSVHCDSHTSNAHGAGTFVLGLHANEQNFEIAKKENSVIYLEDNYQDRYADYDINSPETVIGLTIMQEEFLDQSINLAKTIQDNFANKLKRNDRKVKQAGFIVLHQTFMPSVLVETGFLTNDQEGAYLNSSKGQTDMGKSIADAILSYRNELKAGVVSIDKPTKAPEPIQSTKIPEKEEVKEVVEQTIEVPEEVLELPKKEEVISPKSETPEATVSVPVEEIQKKETPEQLVKDATSDIIKEEAKEVPKPIVSEPIVEKRPEETPKASIIFKVQLLASSKKIALNGSNFNGLNKLSKEPYKNLYRYMYGSAGSLKDAKLLKSNANLKGYSTSYIVAYKDGTRITVKEAMKYVSE